MIEVTENIYVDELSKVTKFIDNEYVFNRGQTKHEIDFETTLLQMFVNLKKYISP